MKRAALIVQADRAMMMVCVGICDTWSGKGMSVRSDRRRLIHVQRMLINQRDDPCHLRNHEECQEGGVEAADCSQEGH
jgi:hypothetical protein